MVNFVKKYSYIIKSNFIIFYGVNSIKAGCLFGNKDKKGKTTTEESDIIKKTLEQIGKDDQEYEKEREERAKKFKKEIDEVSERLKKDDEKHDKDTQAFFKYLESIKKKYEEDSKEKVNKFNKEKEEIDNNFKQKSKEIKDKEYNIKKEAAEKAKKYKENKNTDENKIKEIENKVKDQIKKKIKAIDNNLKEEENKRNTINNENEQFSKEINEKMTEYKKANNITSENFDSAPAITDENNINHEQVMKLLNDSQLVTNRINDQFHYFIMSLRAFSNNIKQVHIYIDCVYFYINNQIEIPVNDKNELKNNINEINNNFTKYIEFKNLFDRLKKDIDVLNLMQFTLKKVKDLNYKERDFLEQYKHLLELNNEYLILKNQYDQDITILNNFVDLNN